MRMILLLLIYLSSNIVYADDVYTITSGSKSSIYAKLSEEIVKEAYTKLGLDVNFKYTAAERSLVLANSGKVDGELFRAGIVEDLYPNLYKINEPLYYVDIVAFSINKDVTINRWSDLEEYKIAIERGIKISEINTHDMFVIKADTLDKAFELLKFKRVDIVICGYLRGVNIATNLSLLEQVKHSVPLSQTPVYHFVHIKNEALIHKLELAIKEIDNESIIKRILK